MYQKYPGPSLISSTPCLKTRLKSWLCLSFCQAHDCFLYVLEIQAVVFVYFLQKLRQLLEYKPILGTQRDFECESPFSHALRLIGAYRKRAVVSPEAAGEQSLNQQRPWESGLAQQTRDSETSPPLYQTSSATEEAGPDTTSQSLESRHLS